MEKHKPVNDKHSKRYNRLLAFFRNAAALLPFIMIPFGLLVRNDTLNNDFYVSDIVFIAISIACSVFSLAYFCILKFIPQKMPHIFFLAGFHVLTIFFVLFVSGFLTAFLAIWIVLMAVSDMLYKKRGFTLSLSALLLTAALSFVVHPDLLGNQKLEIAQGTLIVAIIGYAIAKIRSTTEREQLTLQRTREQESFQRERLLALVNSMGDAVVTTTEDGTIKVYNAALISLLDTNANLTGKNLDKILSLCDKNKKSVSILQDAQAIGKLFSRTDLMHKFNDDEYMRLYINVAPIRPGYQSRTETGFIFIIRDITKEKTLEEERDEFISVVSHELRTPVAIAEGNLSNIQLLQERGAAPEMIKHAVIDSHEQIVYLSKIINDLGTLSRAERGVNAEGTEVINTADFLTEMFRTYAPQAQKKKIHLDLDISPQLSPICSSRLYLEEILQNFITNAIKYTQHGSVTIIGHDTPKGVYIAVKDTGIGMSKTDQRHVFEKFYRSEDYRTRESSGTGLGLYISQKLATKLNIQIQFESRLNHGSTFSILVKPAPEQKK
ncbi:MAG: ATP-binding protein [Candidatus Woesebacteria bacterium]|jgi:PAS domain S-box-containing protein